jgi:hypothetical protein
VVRSNLKKAVRDRKRTGLLRGRLSGARAEIAVFGEILAVVHQ